MAGWAPVATAAIAAAVVLAPLVRPGYALSYDMVFVPHQDLLPASLGLGGGLPRAVPQDAVVALLDNAVPGWLLQRLALGGALLLAGTGAARLLRGTAAWTASLAALLAVWNPWVAERLVLGHWGLLLAYGALPWAVATAIDVRRGRPGAAPRLLLWCALAALTPSGGLLVALVGVPVAVLPRSRLAWPRRLLLAVAAIVLNAPWWLPAVLHPAAGASAAEGTIFGITAEGPWGVLATALGLGGVWNADVVPASRGWPLAPVVAAALVAAALVGFPAWRRQAGRAAAWWLAGCALAGLLLAVAGAVPVTADAVGWLIRTLPGAGLLRDAHKLLAPLALLLAVAAPLGVRALVARVRDREGVGALVVLAFVLPVVALPDLAWGVAGRIVPVAYPESWSGLRAALAAEPGAGDVVVLPWSAFRAFAWNERRTVLDPAPRWLTRTAVVDDTLVVRRSDGSLVSVSGEDPRAWAVGAALAAEQPLAGVLPALGIGFVVVESGQPPPVPAAALVGLPESWSGEGLRLLRVPGPVAAAAAPGYAAVVIAADIGVVLLVLVLAACLVVPRMGTGRPLARRIRRAED